MQKKLKILLVEVNIVYSEMTKQMISESVLKDSEIQETSTLKEARIMLEKFRFDVVLLDLNLRDSIGINTFSTLFQLASDIPFIILFETDQDELIPVVMGLGAQDCFFPVHSDKDKLYRVIEYAFERNRFRQQIQTTAVFYKTLIEESDVITSVLSPEGDVLYVTPSPKSGLGNELDFLNGKNVFQFVHPDDLDTIRKTFFSLLNRPGDMEQIEFRYLHENGNLIYLEGTGKNMLHVPNINGIVVNYKDITKRKEIQTKLQQAQKIANLEYFEFDIRTGNWTNSSELDDIFGIEQNFEKNIEGWLKVLHPAYHNSLVNYFNEYVLKQHPQFDKEFKIINQKTKDDHWVHCLGSIITDSHDKPIKMCGTIQDITQRKNREDELQKLNFAVYQSPVSMIITDTLGNMQFANPVVLSMTGYTAKELIGQNTRLFKSGEHSESFYRDLWETIYNGNVWKGQFHNKKKNGELYWEEATISPIKNHLGEIKNFLSIKEDITGKKEIENKLIESELHYRTLFDESLTGMYNSTKNGKVLKANNALIKMLGYDSFSEYQQVNLDHEPLFDTNRKKFKEILDEKGIITGFESKLLNKSGNIIHIRESARQFVDKTGEIIYEGTVENITKQKKAEVILKDTNLFYKLIIDAGNIGYATYEFSGKCLSANNAYAKIVGAEKHQILVQNFREIEHWKKTNLLRDADKCLQEGRYSKNIIESVSSFNKKVWIEIHLSRIYKNNEIQLLVIIKDISSYMRAKRRQLQTKAEFQILIESVNLPVFGIDNKGKITDWNSVMEILTGFEKDTIKGKDYKSIAIKNKDDSFSFIENTLAGKEVFNHKITLISKFNNKIKLLINTTLHRNVNDKIEGFTCLGQDITEIEDHNRELELKVHERTQKLIEALAKEKELNDLKTQFVSMASHEFRTPLAAISFAAGFVKKYWNKLEDDVRNQKLIKIDTQVKHMTCILEDFLTFGKIESRKIIFDPKNYNLVELLIQIIDDIQTGSKNSHHVQFNYPHKACYLMTDEKIFGHIFNNLIGNAVKFSPDADKVIVNLNESDRDVVFEVIDFGIGIKTEEIKNIFAPFHRGENANTIQGTGLGLAIVKESVDLLKGKISLESNPNKGTKFLVTFPKDRDNKKQQL
jgi:PAS domain S-box-containing protein